MGKFSERKVIAEIAGRQRTGAADLIKGIGDDCAVIRKSPGCVELWTTDTLVEGVHFDLSWHAPELLGRKAVNVNFSDIGAMGGKPRFILLSLGLTQAVEKAWLDAFMQGFLTVLEQYDVILTGGDTVSSGERIMISVTVCGEMDERHVCFRSQAQPDDRIWVTGTLGDAAGGLMLCQKGMFPAEKYNRLCQAHLDPKPPVALGSKLAKSGLIHAMMDLSDGLATDLAHICKASRVGAEIAGQDVPLSGELQSAARSLHFDPLKLALEGGEDYQLVFTAPPQNSQMLVELCSRENIEIICLGRIIDGDGVVLCRNGQRREIGFCGYEHTF
ncbi:MAG: thiamine-phosphate kinase [Desulfobulbaceae bacterium]|nr:thiamine-phosphate kinase [Desulfobulbaceae bacterium]